MKTFKKGMVSVLLLTMITACIVGCGQTEKKRNASVFTGDKDALRIFVRSNSTYADALQEKFPDIKFDFYYYGGLNATMTMNQLMEKDDLGDICINSLRATDTMAKEHLLDLSGYAICSRYEPSILSQFDVEGSIYQLPGYVTMRNIIYNKGMFEQYGWEEPQNFKELTALCRQIRQDTDGVTPIVMAGAASGYYFTTMTSYAQAEFLYTPEGQRWTTEYLAGTAKAADGFGSGIAMLQELIDADAFDYDANLGLWDGDLFCERMLTGEAAMMFGWGGQSYIGSQMEQHPELHFGLMPFRNQEGQAFIGTNIPFYIGLSKELGEKENEKKLENALRVLDWLSTQEGISALSSDTFSAISPLRNVQNTQTYEIYQQFWNEHLDSIKAPMLYAGYEDILVPTADVIMSAVRKETTLDNLAEYIDEIHQDFLTGGASAIEVGNFSCNFTHDETVQLFADILYQKGDSDIALVSDGNYKNGVMNSGGVFSRFLEGPVLEDQMTCCLPGAGITLPAEQLTLTGKQIRELIENGKIRFAAEDGYVSRAEEEENAYEAFDYYFAGITVRWKKGKVVSMTLEDGRTITEDASYTVTFATKDYSSIIRETGSPVELPYTVKDVLGEYLKANSPVSPLPVLR